MRGEGRSAMAESTGWAHWPNSAPITYGFISSAPITYEIYELMKQES